MTAGVGTLLLSGGLLAWLVTQGAWPLLGGWLVVGSGALGWLLRRWAAERERSDGRA